MLDFKPFQTVKISTVISYKYLKSLFFYSYFPIPPQQTHEAVDGRWRRGKLTPRMLNELIEKIEVHQAEKIDGKTVQRLTIHYNCIGAIEIPDLEKIPENKVSVHTRQGVDVHYASCAS